MLPDYSKMFDPQTISQNWQKAMDMGQAMQSSKASFDTWQNMSGMWAKTFTSCYEQNMKMCQGAMDDSIECLRDMSSAKGVDELMQKQAEWTKKATEKCQSNAQTLAQTMQACQNQCTDMITSMMAQNFQNGSNATSKSSAK